MNCGWRVGKTPRPRNEDVTGIRMRSASRITRSISWKRCTSTPTISTGRSARDRRSTISPAASATALSFT